MIFKTRILVILLFVLALSGCKVQQHIQQTRSQYEVAPFVLEDPGFEIISEDKIPGDVHLVVAAIVETMRHDPLSLRNVSFDPSGSHVIADPYFDYSGFSVAAVLVNDYSSAEISRDRHFCRLRGSLLFVDELNRTAINYFQADYEAGRQGIKITRSFSLPASPVFPETQAFILSKRDLEWIMDHVEDFPGFYLSVAARAYSMTPSPEEVRQRKELEQMSFFERARSAPLTQRQDNAMVIFTMDRLTPEAEFEVIVTETLHGRSSIVEPYYLYFNGWRAALFAGEFAVDRDVFHAKVYYRPEQGVLPQGKDEVVVGIFTSEKNYEVQEERTVVQQASYSPAEGPLAAGRIMLSTSNRDEARIIQTRLSELGFYNMAIDGLWGPGSRGALQNFQRSNGLAANGEWNMQSQMNLFSGTGR